MSDTKLIRLVATNGAGIPQSMKTFRTVRVTGASHGNKVIQVVMPQQQQKQLVLAKSSLTNIPPDTHDEDRDEDGVCLSKNARLARENRLKKKRYINGLEQSLAAAKKDNEALVGQLKEKNDTIDQLQKEITYFKSVLSNVREISNLINTIKGDTKLSNCGMPMFTSLEPPSPKKMKLERLSESASELSSIYDEDKDWLPFSPLPATPLDTESLDLLSNFSEDDVNCLADAIPAPIQELAPEEGAGVCLHVFNKKMSLEFCSSCAARAQEKWCQV